MAAGCLGDASEPDGSTWGRKRCRRLLTVGLQGGNEPSTDGKLQEVRSVFLLAHVSQEVRSQSCGHRGVRAYLCACERSDEEHERACPGADEDRGSMQQNPAEIAHLRKDIRNRQLVTYSVLGVVFALALWASYVVLRGVCRTVGGLIWCLVSLVR